jgi:transposase-like protein
MRMCCANGSRSSAPIPLKPEQQEIERLRREVNKLKAEQDILKKATTCFAKEAT